MIHPSYTELMHVINGESEDIDEAPIVSSRYSVVLATSKRARQLIAGSDPLIPGANGSKPLSIAVEEVYRGKVRILSEAESLLAQQQAENEAALKAAGMVDGAALEGLDASTLVGGVETADADTMTAEAAEGSADAEESADGDAELEEENGDEDLAEDESPADDEAE